MKNVPIQIEISADLYTKNPNSSELGQKILSNSIELINEIGFESFTFKKLGKRINSPESSVYRYFKNKHALLIYLTSWYWVWTEYRILFATTNIPSSKKRLLKSIEILTQPVLIDTNFTFINEVLLSEIIFAESIKAYHTKNVDEQNKNGYFKAYKNVVERVSAMVLEVNKEYKHSHMLISTIIEGAHQQKYFAEHIPELTDIDKEKDTITNFYSNMVFTLLNE